MISLIRFYIDIKTKYYDDFVKESNALEIKYKKSHNHFNVWIRDIE